MEGNNVEARSSPAEIFAQRMVGEKLTHRTLSAYVLDRYRIILAIHQGSSSTEVARILGSERPTVYLYQCVYKFNSSGFSEFEKATNPNGQPPVLSSENLQQLVKIALSGPNEGNPAPAFTGLIDYFFNTTSPIGSSINRTE